MQGACLFNTIRPYPTKLYLHISPKITFIKLCKHALRILDFPQSPLPRPVLKPRLSRQQLRRPLGERLLLHVHQAWQELRPKVSCPHRAASLRGRALGAAVRAAAFGPFICLH